MDADLISSNSTTPGMRQGPSIPTAAILCLALGAYVILMLAALIIRRYFKNHEWGGTTCCSNDKSCSVCKCPDCSSCCGKLEETMKSLWCCGSCQPLKCKKLCGSCDGCRTNCNDLRWPCCSSDPMCECGRCNCTCTCNLPKCQSINCCCFEINIAG